MLQNPPANAGDIRDAEIQVRPLCREDPLEEGTATHSRNRAWRIPGTEELGGLQSTGPQRGGHWSSLAAAARIFQTHTLIL